jgi:hypothetical protein
MKKGNQQGGKLTPFSLRGRLHELTGARLHVWLCHWLHSNKEGLSWPSLDLLSSETGLGVGWIVKARFWLRENGWLVRESKEQPRRGNNRFAVVRYFVRMPPPMQRKSAIEKVGNGESQHSRCRDSGYGRCRDSGYRSNTIEVDTVEGGKEPQSQATEPSTGVSFKKEETTQAKGDPRFEAVLSFFRTEFKRLHKINPPLDASDATALRKLLRQQPQANVQQIVAWLKNAFASTTQFPLVGGFRLREFVCHFSKYIGGPLRRHPAEKETEDRGSCPSLADVRPTRR